ncbi:MAG TPA: DUF2891 domain-containing protein [Kofleriaceae bacterium]
MTRLLIVTLLAMTATGHAETLTQAQASQLAKLPLGCLRRELPNKLDHVVITARDVRRPKRLHPAFYGCLDWHSSVHGHWMLVRLLRTFPALPEAGEIRKTLRLTLTAKNLAAERSYFVARLGFERPYGWSWLLQLATELHGWDDADGKKWAASLQPLVDAVIGSYLDYFPKQTYPVRTGVHANTAFGLTFALDHARAVKHAELEKLVVERALTYYGKDVDYPAAWEPSGEDFFSPALIEADLMRRVLAPPKFEAWLRGFFPKGLPPALAKPAIVSDRSDPKLAHLDGLNLSRAWCLRSVASVLGPADPLRKQLATAAEAHAREGLAHVATGHYTGEHWLASFAIFLLGTPSP